MSRERKEQNLVAVIGKAKECRNKGRAVRQRNNYNFNSKSAPRTSSCVSKAKTKSNAHFSVGLQKPELSQTENSV